MADERFWCWTCERRLTSDDVTEEEHNEVRMYFCKTCGDVVEKPKVYEAEA